MTLPVTGPHTWSSPPSRVLEIQKNRYRQKRPHTLRLPYTMYTNRVVSEYNYVAYSNYGGYPYWMTDANMQKTYNQAYRNFVQKIKSDQAAWLVTMAERQKTFAMIADRGSRLLLGIIHAKRGDLKGLRKTWGMSAGIRKKARDTGSHVLEYSFGWAPLVGDIVAGVKTLNDGVPPPVVRGRADYNDLTIKKSNYPWYEYHSSTRKIRRRVQIIGNVVITSPFLALANQLGLVNPALVIYERTPWSFVLNYFVNLDDWLGSFTDFVGFDIKNAATTRAGHSVYTYSVKYHADLKPAQNYKPYGYVIEQYNIARSTGFSRPTLSGRLPWRLSVQRASTSIGLLLQQLK